MIPGEIIRPQPGEIELNAGRADDRRSSVANTRRPADPGRLPLSFLRDQPRAASSTASKARGFRLDIPAGTAVRFEPGQSREVRPGRLCRRAAIVHGFQRQVIGEPAGG